MYVGGLCALGAFCAHHLFRRQPAQTRLVRCMFTKFTAEGPKRRDCSHSKSALIHFSTSYRRRVAAVLLHLHGDKGIRPSSATKAKLHFVPAWFEFERWVLVALLRYPRPTDGFPRPRRPHTPHPAEPTSWCSYRLLPSPRSRDKCRCSAVEERGQIFPPLPFPFLPPPRVVAHAGAATIAPLQAMIPRCVECWVCLSTALSVFCSLKPNHRSEGKV